MRFQDFYPIVVTEHLASCRDFYRRWFALDVAFEATWFAMLTAGAEGRVSLAFMHPAHPSAPPGPEAFSGQGMCLEFQVADARAEDPGGMHRRAGPVTGAGGEEVAR